MYFVLKRSLSICHIDLEFHFQNYRHFVEYFGFYLLTTVYIRKNDTRNFCLFMYLSSHIDKSKCSFLLTVKLQHALSANEPFLGKMLVWLFSSIIPLYIEKKSRVKIK